jgi:hypothetical protein
MLLRLHTMGFTRHNWVSGIFKILDQCNLLHLSDQTSFTKPEITGALQTAKSYFRSEFVQSWLIEMQSKSKLRTYMQFKLNFGPENYLYIYNEKHRRAHAQFRLSSHTLEIERGRWHRNVIPVHDRICTFCPGSPIKDEKHVFDSCILYDKFRYIFLQKCFALCPEHRHLCTNDRFTLLMQSKNIKLNHITAKFVHQITTFRNEILLFITNNNNIIYLILYLYMTLLSVLLCILNCILMPLCNP